MSLTREAIDRFVERQIFFPDTILIEEPGDLGFEFENIVVETSDGLQLHGWFVPADDPRALLLFYHGSAGNISHRLDNISRLCEIGLHVLIFDYRGYGKSEGIISEKGFYLDAEAAYRLAVRRAAHENLKLVLFGRSLGGVAAVHVASQSRCSGLILESTFTHLGAMARKHFPLPLLSKLLSRRLNSLDKIKGVNAPVLFFHGDCDDFVPLELGRQLFEAAGATKELYILEGAGHNDTYILGGKAYFDKINGFVEVLA